MIHKLTYNGKTIEANSNFELANKLMDMQKFGAYPIIGEPYYIEDDEEAFSPLEYWNGEVLFDYPSEIDNQHLLEYAAFSLDCKEDDLELKVEEELAE